MQITSKKRTDRKRLRKIMSKRGNCRCCPSYRKSKKGQWKRAKKIKFKAPKLDKYGDPIYEGGWS